MSMGTQSIASPAEGRCFDVSDEIMESLYESMHAQASRYMRRQPPSHTLQPTALVHEAYLKLFRRGDHEWTSPQHFLAVAARVMVNVLVDHARGKNRRKRRPGGQRVPVEAVLVHFAEQRVDVIDLQAKLEELSFLGPAERRAATVVELRAFTGSTMAEIAAYLRVSKRMVERDFRFARAWLFGELGLGDGTG